MGDIHMHSTTPDDFYQNEIDKNQELLNEISSNDQKIELNILQLQSLYDELSEKSALSEIEMQFLTNIKKEITIFKSNKIQELDVLYEQLSDFPGVTEKFPVHIPDLILPKIQNHYTSKIERLKQFRTAHAFIKTPPLDHFKGAVAEKLRLKALKCASQVTALTNELNQILPFNLQLHIKNLDEILIQNYLVMSAENIQAHLLKNCKDEQIKNLIKKTPPENLFNGIQLQQQISKEYSTQSELLKARDSALISDQNALMQLYRYPSIQISPLSLMNKVELNKFKKMIRSKGKKLTTKDINEFLKGTQLGRILGFTSIPKSITNDEISKIMSHYTKRFSNIYRLVELRLRNNNLPPPKEKPNLEPKGMFFRFSTKGKKLKENPNTSQKKQKPKFK